MSGRLLRSVRIAKLFVSTLAVHLAAMTALTAVLFGAGALIRLLFLGKSNVSEYLHNWELTVVPVAIVLCVVGIARWAGVMLRFMRGLRRLRVSLTEFAMMDETARQQLLDRPDLR